MKKRIRGMTSASRGEKERKRRPLRRARECYGMMRARERTSTPRREAVRNEEAVGRFARVAALSCERRETTTVDDGEEREAVGRPVGRTDEREE